MLRRRPKTSRRSLHHGIGVLLRDRIVEVGMGVINEICRNCTLGNLLLPISTFGSLMFPFLVPGNLEKARKVAFPCSYGDHLLPIAANIWVKSQWWWRVAVG